MATNTPVRYVVRPIEVHRRDTSGFTSVFGYNRSGAK